MLVMPGAAPRRPLLQLWCRIVKGSRGAARSRRPKRLTIPQPAKTDLPFGSAPDATPVPLNCAMDEYSRLVRDVLDANGALRPGADWVKVTRLLQPNWRGWAHAYRENLIAKGRIPPDDAPETSGIDGRDGVPGDAECWTPDDDD